MLQVPVTCSPAAIAASKGQLWVTILRSGTPVGYGATSGEAAEDLRETGPAGKGMDAHGVFCPQICPKLSMKNINRHFHQCWASRDSLDLGHFFNRNITSKHRLVYFAVGAYHNSPVSRYPVSPANCSGLCGRRPAADHPTGRVTGVHGVAPSVCARVASSLNF